MKSTMLPFVASIALAAVTACAVPARAEVTLNGQATLGTVTRQATLLIRCGISRKGAIDGDLTIPGVGPLRGQYDFDSFEGPYAKSSKLLLSTIASTGGSATFTASGSIPVNPSDAFRFGVMPGSQGAGKAEAMTRVLRPVATSGGILTWTQANPVRGGAPLQATFEVTASALSRVAAELAPCVGK